MVERAHPAGFGWLSCDESDLVDVARAQDLDRLPLRYAAWLTRYGRGPVGGSMFHRQGGVAYLPEALDNATAAREIAGEVFRLPPGALVVSTWQGYMFEFVLGDGDGDPPVRTYVEGDRTAGQAHGATRLSAWLRTLVKIEIEALESGE